jgi:hypothetical protein
MPCQQSNTQIAGMADLGIPRHAYLSVVAHCRRVFTEENSLLLLSHAFERLLEIGKERGKWLERS